MRTITYSKNKKAQSWYVDYIISFLIFFAGLMLVLNFLPNASNDGFAKLSLESEILSDAMMSEGVPVNWNTTNVTLAGLTTSNELDTNKLKQLYSIEYEEARSIFGVHNDFYMYFELNSQIQNFSNTTHSNITHYGKNPDTPEHVVHKKRILPYDGNLIVLNLVVWK